MIRLSMAFWGLEHLTMRGTKERGGRREDDKDVTKRIMYEMTTKANQECWSLHTIRPQCGWLGTVLVGGRKEYLQDLLLLGDTVPVAARAAVLGRHGDPLAAASGARGLGQGRPCGCLFKLLKPGGGAVPR